MLNVAAFTFNPFQENTYVVHNGTHAILIDPGCWNTNEEQELEGWLSSNSLKPERLVLTHAHIDHVLGCAWANDRYGLLPELHMADLQLLRNAPLQGQLYGVPCQPPPDPVRFIEAGDLIRLGDDQLRVLFVPGHAPGHIALHAEAERFVITGDALFQGSIGRTDLPGGDYDTLIRSIKEQLLTLGDDLKVYSGHGPETTIGRERRMNPFLR